MIKKIFNKLARVLYVHPPAPEYILSNAEINQLFVNARKKISDEINKNLTSPGLHGSKLSKEIGQGMDYSESRLYSNGDDYRSINWKQSARSDELIVNQYSKEQEPVDYILLDNRPSMYFGSKTQTKISNAIKLVIESMVFSLARGHSLKVFGFNETIQYYGCIKDYKQAFKVVSVISEYHEKINTASVIDITKALQSIENLKPENSNIAVISDFNDMTEKASHGLKIIKATNFVSLYQVKDEIELKLPAIYPVDYQSLNSSKSTSIETLSGVNRFRQNIEIINKTILTLLMDSAHQLILVTNDTRKNLQVKNNEAKPDEF